MKLDFETGFSTLAKYFVKGTILEIDSKCKIKQYKGQMAKNCSTSYSFLLVSLILYYFRNLSWFCEVPWLIFQGWIFSLAKARPPVSSLQSDEIRPMWSGRWGQADVVRPMWSGRWGQSDEVRRMWFGRCGLLGMTKWSLNSWEFLVRKSIARYLNDIFNVSWINKEGNLGWPSECYLGWPSEVWFSGVTRIGI